VVIKRVLVFIEGGGDTRLQQTTLRRGFATLIRGCLGDSPQPQVIVCGGRSQAFRSFSIAVRNEADALSLLLVDSEEAVAEGASPWEHVLRRVGDGWVRPDGVGDDQLFFMAQAMEAWLVADAEALAKFYGKGFRAQDVPVRRNVEEIAKQDLNDALARATRETRAKRYCKSDGFALIGKISAARVRERSPVHATRFFDRLGGAVAGLQR
jgi:hypothetical protein